MPAAIDGVRLDVVIKTLCVDLKVGNIKSFHSAETGFRTVTYVDGTASLQVAQGAIPTKKGNIAREVSDLG